MLRSDYGYDLVEAAIAVEFDRINQLRSRLDQLQAFVRDLESSNPLFSPLSGSATF